MDDPAVIARRAARVRPARRRAPRARARIPTVKQELLANTEPRSRAASSARRASSSATSCTSGRIACARSRTRSRRRPADARDRRGAGTRAGRAALGSGARDWSRTSTAVRPQDSESCASANSATRAGWRRLGAPVRGVNARRGEADRGQPEARRGVSRLGCDRSLDLPPPVPRVGGSAQSPGGSLAENVATHTLVIGDEKLEIPGVLPVLPVRDAVVFPGHVPCRSRSAARARSPRSTTRATAASSSSRRSATRRPRIRRSRSSTRSRASCAWCAWSTRGARASRRSCVGARAHAARRGATRTTPRSACAIEPTRRARRPSRRARGRARARASSSRSA